MTTAAIDPDKITGLLLHANGRSQLLVDAPDGTPSTTDLSVTETLETVRLLLARRLEVMLAETPGGVH